jgi:UPF0755 protein
MGRYKPYSNKRRFSFGKAGLLLVVLSLVAVLVLAAIYTQYTAQLKPVSTSEKLQQFNIQEGSGVSQVAQELEAAELIRSARAMEIYVTTHRLGAKLQAGSYELSPNLGTKAVIATITKGRTSNVLVTILPGRRIDQVRADLVNSGFSPEEVDQALDPTQYSDIPVLAIKPSGILTLEGLLWPDSFQKDASTTASDIIRQSLSAMNEQYTDELKAAFAARGLDPYQGLILASVVEQEVNKPEDRRQVAQVFLLRLQKGMKLGSDVTARYGAISAGLAPSLTYDSAYNTLLHGGLPPTPISSVHADALEAVANPAGTDWLYFVTGDNGTTYFSRTNAEHEALASKYCHKLCGR